MRVTATLGDGRLVEVATCDHCEFYRASRDGDRVLHEHCARHAHVVRGGWDRCSWFEWAR